MTRSFQTSQPYGGYGEVQMGVPASRIQQFNQSDNQAIRAGGAVLGEAPEVFPATRKCRDVVWIILFLAVLGALGYFAYTESRGWSFHGDDFDQDAKKVGFKAVLFAIVSSVAVACPLALVFLALARCCTKVVVWVALLFTPTAMLIEAVSFIAFPKVYNFQDPESRYIACACLAIPALLLLTCYICCWRKLIDFTTKILYAVAGILGEHLGLCVVALVSLVFSILWATLCFASLMALSSKFVQAGHVCEGNDKSSKCLGKGSFYGLYFLTFLIFAWGTTIFQNVGHTTNCCVFGRWYFRQAASVRSSLWVSLTTSFGSICLGSLIIAFISAVEATLRMMRRSSGRNNVAQMVVLCVLECLISCIRDMAEAFSYFTYVQVAIRGLSFWSSAKATYALCKWDNLYGLIGTTLVGNVCALGSVMCGLLSGVAGYLVGARFIPKGLSEEEVFSIHILSIVSATLIGIVTARTILNVLRSGFATIVVCWAENKEALQSLQCGLYDDFNQRGQALYNGPLA